MKHTVYFKITNALVKVQCEDDDSLNTVFDDMRRVGADMITAAEFNEENVLTHLSINECTLSFIEKTDENNN